VKTLQERLAKDSHNSSLPPSSDRFARQQKSRSLRQKSGKKAGGQQGHTGATLERSEEPDEVIALPVTQCQHCQADLASIAPKSMERRQLVDVPPLRLQVTEYQGEWKQCPHCQGYTSTVFPEEVKAAVQYGPRVGAMAVYLLMQHHLPWARTCEVLADLLGVHLSEGTLAGLLQRTASKLLPVETQIKEALVAADVLHQDESGLSVLGKRWWVHVACTLLLTHYAAHPKRGQEALKAIGISPRFRGTSVHDCWQSYFACACTHALCLVHILRELTFLAEEHKHAWAAKLITLLLAMKAVTEQKRAQGQTSLLPQEIAAWTTQYQHLLAQAEALHPRAQSPPGQRGRVKQSAARNLLDRLQTHQDAVLAFLSDLRVPFDNNLAERDIRMVKLQQKISGTFRSSVGAVIFCRIRGSLSTL
jgi:transposase